MMFNADIAEMNDGKFSAVCRETGTRIVSADPEHSLCHEMIKTQPDLVDGSIQFWRGVVPTLCYKSVVECSARRIAMGEVYPNRRVKRGEGGAEFFSERRSVRAHTGKTEADGTLPPASPLTPV